MNAFAPVAGLTVQAADLSEPRVRGRIDDFVHAEPSAEVFHRPQWSIAVERGCRTRSHYLLAEDRHGAIAGILPLSEVRSPLFGSALVSTGFGVGGGIVARGHQAAEALAVSAWELAQRLGCPSVELRGGHIPEGWNRREGLYVGFARDLAADEAAILKSIPRKQRAEVRRAQAFELHTAIGSSATDRAAHYRVYSESVRNLGTPVFPRALFEAMLDAFGADADILTVSKDGTVLASVLSFYFRGTVFPYWGGGTAAARVWRANDHLYFELMRHASARGCTRFDFGRSKLGTGAYAFKKNWGFEPHPLVYSAKGLLRETNPMSAKYRLQVALWKKLPLWLANRVGPPVAVGLG